MHLFDWILASMRCSSLIMSHSIGTCIEKLKTGLLLGFSMLQNCTQTSLNVNDRSCINIMLEQWATLHDIAWAANEGLWIVKSDEWNSPGLLILFKYTATPSCCSSNTGLALVDLGTKGVISNNRWWWQRRRIVDFYAVLMVCGRSPASVRSSGRRCVKRST